MTPVENRAFWILFSLFILFPLLVLLLAATPLIPGAWTVAFVLLALTWLGLGLMMGSGYITGEA